MEPIISEFLEYLDASPSSFQAAEQSVSRLARAGFCELKEEYEFDLQVGGKYYLCRNQSSVIAFVVGSSLLDHSGYKLCASHLDSPLLKLKPDTIKTDKGITRIAVEVYGGPIIHTWTDRELGIAGRISLKNNDNNGIKLKNVLINLARPLAIIPNAAIHLNRDINKGFEYDKQIHLQAILATTDKSENPLKNLIATELNVLAEQIAEMDLFLYDIHKAALVGIDNSMICSGRLDNLAMSHAILSSLISVNNPASTCVAVLYDNEEIGSQTLQGANSSYLGDILERIALAMDLSRSEYLRALKQSFLISADMAHALHPAYESKHDPAYAPKMNCGPVIKMNANYRYSTTSDSASEFIKLCDIAAIPYQKFMTRSDLPCGSTIGPVASSTLGIRSVDIGNPMWAMHSIRETCGVRDHISLIRILDSFWDQ